MPFQPLVIHPSPREEERSYLYQGVPGNLIRYQVTVEEKFHSGQIRHMGQGMRVKPMNEFFALPEGRLIVIQQINMASVKWIYIKEQFLFPHYSY